MLSRPRTASHPSKALPFGAVGHLSKIKGVVEFQLLLCAIMMPKETHKNTHPDCGNDRSSLQEEWGADRLVWQRRRELAQLQGSAGQALSAFC